MIQYRNALSDEMKRFIRVEMAKQIKQKGAQDGLFDALYSDKQLKLYYDSERTRNAAETFNIRSGNCLSLVIMTGAFAKELGLRVHYQRVLVDESWTRNSGIFFASGHVNLVLGSYAYLANNRAESLQAMTIDFSPTAQTGLLVGLAQRTASGGWCIIRTTPDDGSWRFRATQTLEWFARGIAWMTRPAVAFPTLASIAHSFPEAEFSHDIRPLWGNTPFNSWLLAFQRR